eukprot:892806-Rhodomonas_salina.1
MIRYVLPAFDQAVVIYQKQMDAFGVLSTMLTSGAAGLTSFVVLIIAIDVLRARVELLKVPSHPCLGHVLFARMDLQKGELQQAGDRTCAGIAAHGVGQ